METKSGFGLGSKFAFIIVLLITTAAGILVFLYDKAHINNALEQTENNFQRYTHNANAQLLSHIEEVKRNLEMLSISPSVNGITRSTANFGIDPMDGSTTQQWKERLAETLIASAKAHPSYTQMRYIGINGGNDFGHEYMRVDRKDGVLGITPFHRLLDRDEESAFSGSLMLLQGEYFISDLTFQAEEQQHSVSLATPIYAHDGILFGSLIIQLSLNKALTTLSTQLPKHMHYSLLSTNGETLNSSIILTDEESKHLGALPLATLSPTTINGTPHFGFRTRIYFDERSTQRHWDLLTIVPENKVVAYPFSHQATLLAIAVFSLTALFISHYFITRITRPLSLLAESAKRMARGNYRDIAIPETDTRELRQLASAMYSAAADISSRERELDQLNEQLEAGIYERSIELDHQTKNLMTAQRIAQLGSWSWHLPDDSFSGSDQMYRILQMQPNQCGGNLASFINAFAPDKHMRLKKEFESLVSQQEFRIKLELTLPSRACVLLEGEVVAREHGIPVQVEGILFDITHRKDHEEQQRLLASVFSHSSEGIFITDKHLNIVQINPSFTKITGITAAEAISASPEILCRDFDDKSLYARITKTLETKTDWRGELELMRFGIQPMNIWVTLNKVCDDSGDVSNYIGVLFDVTEKKSADARISYLAFYDTLTGLANRRLFEERLHQSVRMCRRSKNSLALLYIDLDRFKSVNDSLGHKTGDLLLKQVGEQLKASVRESDTVARLGGDEFAIILEEAATGALSQIAESILTKLSRPFSLDGHEAFVGASIGISVYPKDGDTTELLAQHADVAMYRAKDAGRNNYQFFSPDMNLGAQERLAYETALRHAIDRNQLSLHFQPQANLRTGKVIGFESLLRWYHPEYGSISPVKFIPIAEDTGLIDKIGEWALLEACKQRIAWSGIVPDNARMAVNISARQFRTNIVDFVKQILSETHMPARWLELEITESTLIQDAERAQQVLKELSELGIQLAIDDFGTGYSSLSYLKRFTVDKLKIDRSFIKDLPSDSDDIAITSAVIAMASHLGLKVIAEGTETVEQIDFLRAYGCDEIQGYYFAKPMPAKEVEKLLTAQRLELQKIA